MDFLLRQCAADPRSQNTDSWADIKGSSATSNSNSNMWCCSKDAASHGDVDMRNGNTPQKPKERENFLPMQATAARSLEGTNERMMEGSDQRLFEGSDQRLNEDNAADFMFSMKPSDAKESRQQAFQQIDLEQNSYGGNRWQQFRMPVNCMEVNGISVKCGPSCQKRHAHNFEYDFTKSYKDPISKRPGIDFNIDPKIKQEIAKGIDPNLVEFGQKQTPINLSSRMQVLQGFEDTEFQFHYNRVDDKRKQLKFNQTGDAFYFDIAKGKPERENRNQMKTSTISLFDPHISCTTLQGAQFHFHAPSEHSIDGKLLDLEMHIVHLMGAKDGPKSQFVAGVLGFFFKVMPAKYFKEMNTRYPQADVEWHDRFMLELVMEENDRNFAGSLNEEGLDLTEFVEKLNFNKRWTYQGSLTTAPCDEGILWNVVENVIPIRQSTLDMFTKMRQVEGRQVMNKIAEQDPKTIKFLEELKEDIPVSKKSQMQGGNQFMRVAGCNRKVQDQNGRAVYRIDIQD